MDQKASTTATVKEELQRLLPDRSAQAAWLALAAAFVFFYWVSLRSLFLAWYGQEDYQHGFFVPLFSLFLLWYRREIILDSPACGSYWGLAFFALWAFIRWVAVYYNYGTVSEWAMIPLFMGIAVFVGGWQWLLWSWPAIVFLFFMIPLPIPLRGLASMQLQMVATKLSVYVIQTFGIPAVSEGNVIRLTEKPLEVARACSGLRMMMLFFAICIGAAFVAKRPLWEKLIMVASAAPIAVMANVIRIVITAVVYELASYWPSVINLETTGELVHDWAGYAMMPIGLLLLWGEMAILSKLMLAPVDQPLVIGRVLSGTNSTVATTERVLRRRRG